jgi:glycosyltransferase involved in cell wall biosynthesis
VTAVASERAAGSPRRPAVAHVRVVIPALDAAPTVGGVVAGVRAALPHASVVVVDDGSTDATGRSATAAGATVLAFPVNRGKGAALRAAFAQALEDGADAVLTLDADGQHDPAAAPRLVASLAEADVVVGVRRRMGTRMPLHRRLSNAVSSWAISRCAGTELPDTQSGYRAVRAEVLRRVQPHGDRYEYETDFLILAARAGFRIAGVAIPTIYGAPSHFRPLPDAARVVATIWRHRRNAFR